MRNRLVPKWMAATFV